MTFVHQTSPARLLGRMYAQAFFSLYSYLQYNFLAFIHKHFLRLSTFQQKTKYKIAIFHTLDFTLSLGHGLVLISVHSGFIPVFTTLVLQVRGGSRALREKKIQKPYFRINSHLEIQPFLSQSCDLFKVILHHNFVDCARDGSLVN